jgi:hypothetical protein
MYRYVFSAKHQKFENAQARQAIGYISTQDGYIENLPRSGQEDAAGYFINIEEEKVNPTIVHPAETQVLRKIRI